MTLVVSFTQLVPPLRRDGQPWTRVQIAEGAALDAPFSVIDTQSLTPDPTPASPAAIDLSTTKATLAEGVYALTFLDADGNLSQPVVQMRNAASQARPTVEQLGAFMRARTVVAGTGGQEAGTFTDDTRPTAAQADALIDQATSVVLMQTGPEVPDRLMGQTAFVVLLHAAMLVELSFYRNEVSRDQSAYAQYEQLYANGVKALRAAIADEEPASPQASFWSVPVLNAQQSRFQSMVHAFDAQTGAFDASKLPPDLYYPAGPGGIPPALLNIWPWLADTPLADMGLAWLEAPS